jgi:hypothetical protein
MRARIDGHHETLPKLNHHYFFLIVIVRPLLDTLRAMIRPKRQTKEKGQEDKGAKSRTDENKGPADDGSSGCQQFAETRQATEDDCDDTPLRDHDESDDDGGEEKVDLPLFQECPVCGVMTEKTGGCNVITCAAIVSPPHGPSESDSVAKAGASAACETKWCWVCRKIKGEDDPTRCSERKHRSHHQQE